MRKRIGQEVQVNITITFDVDIEKSKEEIQKHINTRFTVDSPIIRAWKRKENLDFDLLKMKIVSIKEEKELYNLED